MNFSESLSMTSTAARSGGKVLVVDDEQGGLELIMDCLEKYSLTLTRSGEEALHLIDDQAPDVVLVDLMMPGMGGLELIRRLRQHAGARLLTIIVITGWGEPDLRKAAIRAGANEVLSKPFNVFELECHVHSAVQLKRLMDDL